MAHGARGAALFGAQAALYAAHRPSYPPELYEAVLRFAGLADAPSRRRLAVDVATGSGQVAAALAGACGFECVLACDSSEGQLAHAERRPNIEYFHSPAERLDRAGSGTVDLVTAAQALHWCAGPGRGCAVSQTWRLPWPGPACLLGSACDPSLSAQICPSHNRPLSQV